MVSTTSLLVEHLISGSMAIVWIGLILLCCYPSSFEVIRAAVESNSVSLIIFAVFGYPIGMIIDNFADLILSRIKNKHKNNKNYLSVTELLHYIEDENIHGWFEYNRFKIRIMRACFLNSVISIIVLSCCILYCNKVYAFPLLIFFTLLCGTSFYAWRKEIIATYKTVDKWRVFIGK